MDSASEPQSNDDMEEYFEIDKLVKMDDDPIVKYDAPGFLQHENYIRLFH